MFPQPNIAGFVTLGPIADIMREAINFDRQIGAGTEEIEGEVAGRVLLAEPYATGRSLKLLPQQHLRWR